MAQSHPVVSHPYVSTLIRIKAKQLCRRSEFTRCELEDIQQRMRQTLIEKAGQYDPDRGNLEAFITMVIKTWIAEEIRYRNRELRRQSYSAVPMDSTTVDCDGDSVPLTSVLGEADLLRRLGRDPQDDIERLIVRDAIDHAMKRLTPEQQGLLIDIRNSDTATAAKRHGISESTVRRRLAAMRDAFSKAGLGPE